MANYNFNWMIATHEDKAKVRDLYRFSYSENFFEKIFPSPAEFINDTDGDTKSDRRTPVSDRLARWRSKNWGCNEWPFYELGDFRELSKSGTIFTTRFAMRTLIPFGIYDELQRQGFRVKAYCLKPCYYCGTYIYGVQEFSRYWEEGQDVPDDIKKFFDVDYYENRGFDSSSVDEKELNDKEDGAKQCKVIESEEDFNNYFLGTSDSSQ